MIRPIGTVLAKAATQAVFGRVPGGPLAYEQLTRGTMGTAASHIDKLARVWPEYAEIWARHLGRSLEGATVWSHEIGATPYCPLAAFLLTGSAGVSTISHGRLRARYLAKALDTVCDAAWTDTLPRRRRAQAMAGLRWHEDAARVVRELGGQLLTDVDPAAIPLPRKCVDLCHSGGALEHLRPHALARFLAETRRIVRPGGLISHVFDHRDHLHHVNHDLPFAAHLALPRPLYALAFGHPLGYHNRMTPTDVVAAFERAGFEMIEVRRLVYGQRSDERRWVTDASSGRPGLSRRWLARRFVDISDADLATAAAHYLARRRPDAG